MERADLDTKRSCHLEDVIGGIVEFGERWRGDAQKSGVDEFAVAGDELFLSLLDGLLGSTVIGADAEALLGSVSGVGLDLGRIPNDRALALRASDGLEDDRPSCERCRRTASGRTARSPRHRSGATRSRAALGATTRRCAMRSTP